MKINPPRSIRAVLYLIALFATPTVVYLLAEENISDSLAVLLTAFIAVINGLAVVNTVTGAPSAADSY